MLTPEPASLAAALVQLQGRLPAITTAELTELARAVNAELGRRQREAIAREQDTIAEAGEPGTDRPPLGEILAEYQERLAVARAAADAAAVIAAEPSSDTRTFAERMAAWEAEDNADG